MSRKPDADLHAPIWRFMGEPGHEEAFGRARVYDGAQAAPPLPESPRRGSYAGQWCTNPQCIGGALLEGRCTWCGTSPR